MYYNHYSIKDRETKLSIRFPDNNLNSMGDLGYHNCLTLKS